jgi:cellulose synthase/poly-beta-1,6-N-acetylglucosamine synthase-like glycosyltransferase
MDWLWGTGWFWLALFWVALAVNARATLKLLLDWKGMLTTIRFVERAYRDLAALPDEAALAGRGPRFVHLVPAFEEPGIADTLRALLASRYPHGDLHVVVATKAAEERAPHPRMEAPTAELVRRFRDTLPPWQQKQLSLVVLPDEGRKADQLNHALRPETLRALLGDGYDPARVWVGVSDADSIPDPNVYRWIAGEALAGRHRLAYQGVTLSLANFGRLDPRGRVCAIQQSSIFIRVSIARLINEARRVRWFERLGARAPGLAGLIRPVFELAFRRSQICLGHNQFVRLDVLLALGGFPAAGATEDSTLGYALGARGIVLAPLPLLELVDLPETTDKMVRQNARWYRGVLDDVRFLRDAWRAERSAYNLAQLCRHVGNKVVEWPIAAVVYPTLGFLGWHLAYRFADRPWLFVLGVAFPTLSLALTVWVGGIVTQTLVERLTPLCPAPVDARRTTLGQKLRGVFRCQTYWLLATRGAWRVLWPLALGRRYVAAKTDRVSR